MKKNIYILILLCNLSVFAQSKVDKANKSYNEMDYKKAIELYEDALKNGKASGQETVLNLANSYFNLNDYSNAKKWYDKLYEMQQSTMTEPVFIRYIECLKANRDNNKANDLLKNYYKDDATKIKTLAFQKKELDSLNSKKSLYTIQNLQMNSKLSDFGAEKYGPNKVIFYSTRDTSAFNSKNYNWNDQPYLNTYLGEKNLSSGEIDNITPFLNNLNSNYHDATVAFSKDLKTVYYTTNYSKKNRMKTNKDGYSNMKIVKGQIENNEIVNQEVLNFNDEMYSCGHPTLSDDGKYLFFTSDMPGGYGATDIYYVELFEDGTNNSPINAGPTINTAGREMFPYFVDNILYFASDAHFGMGGLDIFESKMEQKGHFSIPLNLGEAINSNMDDFAYTFDATASDGYFSSNRVMGKGDDDIYYFKKEKPKMYQTYSGNVLDEKTNEPIPFASVNVTDEFGDEIQAIETDSLGYYKLTLPCDSDLKLKFSKENYSSKTVGVITDNVPEKEMKNNIVYLVNYESLVDKEGEVEKIKVAPIYFDLDKYDITPQAETELNKVYYAMTEFPNITIKIESHTDSRGSDSHNLKLSDNRAKSTQKYLISKGIDPSRIISAIGYGETRLKVNCPNGVKCTEEQHAINRRSDFIIISK
ncbi:OmpA family protein [Flavobacterium chuncheonense]|uniref:OmpA family protein n=1 Tax=Flavobacterium chuncheonense TaxID=2026653 RepID=A0ABW5YIX9_9FLAO